MDGEKGREGGRGRGAGEKRRGGRGGVGGGELKEKKK